MSSSWKMAALFAVALVVAALTGCGDDDGTGETDASSVDASSVDAASDGGLTTCARVDFFCANHVANCMFGDGGAQYANDAECRAAFCSYSEAKTLCVENAVARASDMPVMY